MCGMMNNEMKVSQRVVRSLVRSYVRRSPIERGKLRLIEAVRPFDGSRQFVRVETELLPGVRIETDLHSHIERQIYYLGFYPKWLLRHFDPLLRRGDVFVDVGANVGSFTLWGSARVGRDGRVFSFEPSSDVFARLTRNIQLNQLQNVTAHRMIVSDADGEAVLYCNREDHANAGQASLAHFDFHQRSETTPAVRLDSLLSGLERLDVLKVDTQGAEMKVLRGAVGLIERHRPVVLLRSVESKVRALGDSTLDLQELLLARGYHLYTIEDEWHRTRRHTAQLVGPLDLAIMFIAFPAERDESGAV
jgi:FkbM family methyltransferase